MQNRRQGSRPAAVGGGLAIVFMLSIFGGSDVVLGTAASPLPSAEPSPSPSAELSPPAEPACGSPSAIADPPEALPGGSVPIWLSGFPPNAAVSLLFVSLDGDPAGRPVGADTTDEFGEGVIDVFVPDDAPVGDAVIRVTTEDGCTADAPFAVVPSFRSITIDDHTVIPGQRVTLKAGGFMGNGHVVVSIDTFPTQGECWPHPCRFLATATTSAIGSVVIRVEIPRDTTPGAHSLWVSGYMAGGEVEDSLGVDITVVGGTLPPTDTAA